ncbi:TPA: glycosyltransferase family 2 protein [Photobacterium damselae]
MSLISIITPIYNSSETISETIESVLSQKYTKWELILCDDNSSDNSLCIIESYLIDNRIKVVKNEFNKGAAGARNTGLKYANGDYICFLDSDDIWDDEKLKEQYLFMKKNSALFSYGCYFTFKKCIKDTIGFFNPPKKISYENLLGKCDIGCSTVMIHKSLLINYKFPELPKEDYAFWLMIFKNSNITAYCFPGVHCYYRLSSGSLSSNKFKEIFKQYKVLSEISGKNKLNILLYMLSYIMNGLKKHLINYN